MKLAMVFPGQGSQSIGMLSALAKEEKEIEQTFAEASDVLQYDLWKLVQSGTADELNQTWRTQPALLSASVAIWRVWQAKTTLRPDIMAGHSLGEYSALVCAGAMTFSDAVRLVALRGHFMQQAVPEGMGAMYALLGLDEKMITALCQEVAQQTKQIVSPVNLNSSEQVVIAGEKTAVEKVVVACKSAGVKRALALSVSVPSHCHLMKPAADQLKEALASIRLSSITIPVVNNVDVLPEKEPEKISDALVRQLYNPVRWRETVEYISSQGTTDYLELGPGKVLTGLIKRIVVGARVNTINDPTTLLAALELY